MFSKTIMPNPADNLISRRQNIYLLSIHLFFAASLAATIFAWYLTAQAARNRAQELFFLDSNNATAWISTRINNYLDILTGARAFAENVTVLDQVKWASYVRHLGVFEKYPGLRSVVYVQKVPSVDKNSFIKKIKKENQGDPAYANYTIRAIDPGYQKDQADYFPVAYIGGPNVQERLAALGYDLSSEKKRAETLFAAHDNAKPATTPLIRFVTPPINNGFGIILPIYQKGLPTDTIKQLRQAVSGAIYAPFDINQFFDSILKPNHRDAFPNLDLEVYDLNSEASNSLIYDKDQSISLTRDPSRFALTAKQTLSLPDRHWEIMTGAPNTSLVSPLWQPIPLIILIGGTFASLATLTYLLYQYRRQIRCQP